MGILTVLLDTRIPKLVLGRIQFLDTETKAELVE